MLRRPQIQAHDISRFTGKLRIGGNAPTPPSLQLDLMLAEYPPYLVIAHVRQGFGQQATIPLAIAGGRVGIQQSEDSPLRFLIVSLGLAWPQGIAESFETVAGEALPPFGYTRGPST